MSNLILFKFFPNFVKYHIWFFKDQEPFFDQSSFEENPHHTSSHFDSNRRNLSTLCQPLVARVSESYQFAPWLMNF